MNFPDWYIKEKERARLELKDAKKAKYGLDLSLEEYQRIEKGGVDYALYNLVLTRADFRTCETAIDSCRQVYNVLWPYIAKLIKENSTFRDIIEGMDPENFTEGQFHRINDIFDTPGDPTVVAKKVLTEIKEAAAKRAKSGIKVAPKKIIL